jgi:predicted ATPase
MDQTGARYDEPELYRLRGELLRRQAVLDAAPAEACFQQALAIARRQQAKSWELRGAMRLARLWQQAVTRYLETLEQIVYADALGFDITRLAELHFYR